MRRNQWLASIGIRTLTTFNGVAQSILPNWVRGRGLAIYLTVFNGAMTFGTLGWGLVAQAIGVPAALVACAVLFICAVMLLRNVRLPADEADLGAANAWPDPFTPAPLPRERGPVMVLVEYRIAAGDRAMFLSAIGALSEARRRDGAYGWGVTEDAADPERILERFMVESWAEHLRQHKRVSHADAELQRAVDRFHTGPDAPLVRHFLAL